MEKHVLDIPVLKKNQITKSQAPVVEASCCTPSPGKTECCNPSITPEENAGACCAQPENGSACCEK